MSPRPPSRRLVPDYLATGGRAGDDGSSLERLSVLHAASPEVPTALSAGQRRVLELLPDGCSLPLAEVAVHLGLPFSIARVLAADLVDAGYLRARPPIPAAQQPDQDILEKLINGLNALKS
ncbi:DUF742 domain-containing protein [Streptomyces sp. NPDC004647]|uniref:DUF742 domain-containing protein n=1 Tax=Streptomyces sp. NPDC004647 TaxID=3154671 RepID=UPI0033B7242E